MIIYAESMNIKMKNILMFVSENVIKHKNNWYPKIVK